MKRILVIVMTLAVALLPASMVLAQTDTLPPDTLSATPEVTAAPALAPASYPTKLAFIGPRLIEGRPLLTGGLGLALGQGFYSFTFYDVGGSGSGAGEEVIKFIGVPQFGVRLLDLILPDYAGPCAGSSVDYGTVKDSTLNSTAYWTGSAGGVGAWDVGKWGGLAVYGRIESNFDDASLYETNLNVGVFAWLKL